ncbi:hypothetical protein RFI_25002 [Reticulomyxa filosa]|uniref:Uncharacterized protein n=1 Tax=Reticulomyxa filosa TaxID=46433 RepID=X6MFH5_RETFI|nr:hypothetical protein RFI_25002 [Reticulomyxa filosa]|eukprot:ETO12371.1 hypothetical protein RFI_25002 [Reticulomyxa filosa]
MSSKDITFIEELFPLEGGAIVTFAANCKTQELSKNAKVQERILGITEMRICLVKSRLVGRSCDCSYLWTELAKLSMEKEDTIRLSFKTGEGTHVFDVIESNEKDAYLIVSAISQCINQLKQCLELDVEIEKKTETKSDEEEINMELTHQEKFLLAYKMHCAREKRPVDAHLIEEMTRTIEECAMQMEDSSPDKDTIFELDDVLRYVSVLKGQKKHVVNPIDVNIILKSLLKVPVFTAYHLDRLPLDVRHVKAVARTLSQKSQVVQNLAMRGCEITTEHIKCLFKHLASDAVVRLNSLGLSGNAIQEAAFFQSFDASKMQARRLYLSNCQLTEKCVAALVELMLSKPWQSADFGLIKVDLSQNSFKDSTAIVCSHLGKYLKTNAGYLEAFVIKYCHLPLTFLEDAVLNTGSLLENLQVVECSGNEMTIYGASGLSRLLKQSKALRYVSLRDMNLNEGIIVEILLGALANEGGSANPIILDFGLTNHEMFAGRPNAITNALKTLAKESSKHGRALKGLVFSNNSLHETFPEFIQALTAIQSLEKLVLDHNFASKKKGGGVEGIVCLTKALEKMPNLSELEIRGVPDEKQKLQLTYKDLQPLFEYLKTDTKLKSIILDGNKIEDSGCALLAEAIAANSSLESISIEDCKITSKGIEHLLKAVNSSSKTNLQYLLPNRTMDQIQKTASKKEWKKVSELVSQALPILQQNIDKKKTKGVSQRQSVSLANAPNASHSIQQLANLLAGKPLMANKKYEAKEFAYATSPDLDIVDEKQESNPKLVFPKSKGPPPARFRAFSSGIRVETEKDVSDLKMEMPTTAQGKRHKRTRKKINV